MELDEFVKTALSKILSGIRQAQEIEGVGAFIVPSKIGGHDYASHSRVSIKAHLSSTIVDFDIAVTVEENCAASGSGGLKIAGIGAKLEGQTSSKDTRISRIQFAVPILLPESQKQWHLELQESPNSTA
ncbi:MAG: hypothetical protein ACXWTK_01545 [Methylobacter sp.]